MEPTVSLPLGTTVPAGVDAPPPEVELSEPVSTNATMPAITTTAATAIQIQRVEDGEFCADAAATRLEAEGLDDGRLLMGTPVWGSSACSVGR